MMMLNIKFLVLVGIVFLSGTVGVSFIKHFDSPVNHKQLETPTPITQVNAVQGQYIEAPIPTPTSTPVPIRKQEILDPIVDCVSDWEKQQGQTKMAKKSVCDLWIDCHLEDKVIRAPKEMCSKYQVKLEELKKQVREKQKQQEGMVKCNLSFGDLGIMKKEECQRLGEEQVKEQVKKELHEKTLRDAEQELRLRGLTQEEINTELYRLDQDLKARGL